MKRPALFLTVFITGMSVTAVELTASRLLAPYFGASLFIWTNIIGVVLLALALGYYFGGRIADKEDGKMAHRIFFPIILTTGVLITIIPFAGKPVFLFAYSALVERSGSMFLSSLFVTLILFTIPLLLLGMVSPLAARIGITKLNESGGVIGSLYAFSTTGSILGTFLPVLVTVPLLGSRETFFLFGGVLMMVGIVGLRKAIFGSLLTIPLALLLFPTNIHANPDLKFEGESAYNYIRVQENSAGNLTLITNEGLGVQSLKVPGKTLTGFYWDNVALLPALNPAGENFLIIGAAGGSSARVLNNFFPELNLTGVEIDPLMIEVGKKFFGIAEMPMELVQMDGRIFLRKSGKKYDFMMIDVYRDEVYIPFHLATKEFFDLVFSKLADSGSIMMNVASASTDSAVLALLRNTVTAAFPYVYEFRADSSYNSLLFAFKNEPNFGTVLLANYPLELRKVLADSIGGMKRITHDPSENISLDNKSPIDLLTEQMIISEAL